MWVTNQILNTALDTLKTRKSRWHSFCCYTTDCVRNSNYNHKSNFLYPSKSMSKFSTIFHFCLMKGIYCNGSAAISSFSYVKSVIKFVSTFLNVPVGNIYLLVPWCDQSDKHWNQEEAENLESLILQDRYFLDFHLNLFLKNLVSSGNSIWLLVVLRKSSIETVREDTVLEEKTLMYMEW